MVEFKCPFAFERNTEQFCRKTEDYCGNQRFCQMKGRWVLTEAAEKCPKRNEEEKPKKKGKK